MKTLGPGRSVRAAGSWIVFLIKFSAIVLLAIGIFYLMQHAANVAIEHDLKTHTITHK